MADKPLTPKQERYVQGLFAGKSQREAYVEAYDTANMKSKTIDEKACLLAGQGKIKARLKELQDEVKDAIKAKNIITVEEILTEYAKIAKADIKDFLNFGMKDVIIEGADGSRMKIPTQIIEVKDSDEVDGTMISEVSISKDGTFKFKLHDKLKALEMAGKHQGMFVEKHEVTGKDGAPIEIESPEQRQKRIEALLKKRDG